VVGSAAELSDCASPDAYYKLGVDMLIAGISGVRRELRATPR
jgi:hypothetical protein